MLQGQLHEAPDGALGFDANEIVGAVDAAAFVARGYRFARRYIRRDGVNPYDLNPPEITRLLNAGLGIAPVQHVERDGPPWWKPTGDTGLAQGLVAVSELVRLGFPSGTMVALDLEGIAPGTLSAAVVHYCQNWHGVVSRAGYVPDLYVGDRCGLTPTQLYYGLSFTRYWRAGSESDVDGPAVRGYCMRQRWRTAADVPPGVNVDFNVDMCIADRKGGRAIIFAPANWRGTPIVVAADAGPAGAAGV